MGREIIRGKREGVFTDELVSLVEILAEVLLSGIGGRKLLVEDAVRLVESGQVGRHVEDARYLEFGERLQIGGVAPVAQIKEGQDLGGRMRVHVPRRRHRHRRRRVGRRHHRRRRHHRVALAQLREVPLEFRVATCKSIMKFIPSFNQNHQPFVLGLISLSFVNWIKSFRFSILDST